MQIKELKYEDDFEKNLSEVRDYISGYNYERYIRNNPVNRVSKSAFVVRLKRKYFDFIDKMAFFRIMNKKIMNLEHLSLYVNSRYVDDNEAELELRPLLKRFYLKNRKSIDYQE